MIIKMKLARNNRALVERERYKKRLRELEDFNENLYEEQNARAIHDEQDKEGEEDMRW